LLNELAQKRIMGIVLKLPADLVTTKMIDSIEKICKENVGNSALQLYLQDEKESLQVELLSRVYRVRATNSCVHEFRKLAELGVVTEKGNVRWLTEEMSKDHALDSEGNGTKSPTFVLDSVEL
jgi:hypothetical protein